MAEPQADKGWPASFFLIAGLFWGGETQENPGALHSGAQRASHSWTSTGWKLETGPCPLASLSCWQGLWQGET